MGRGLAAVFESSSASLPSAKGKADPSAVLSSAQANSAEESHSLKESPPNQASYSLEGYEDLFPGFPPPALQPGQPGFDLDAPPELLRAMKMDDGDTSVLCGASVGDSRISCGVHLFDDPKSGAPYVVPLPDTGRALKAVMPIEEEAGGADDEAHAGDGFPLQQASAGFAALFAGMTKRRRRRHGAFLDGSLHI
ncbi:unnamed protein product [Effrenium voratum]|nr:unnamed protein product [Effrenium voratum]